MKKATTILVLVTLAIPLVFVVGCGAGTKSQLQFRMVQDSKAASDVTGNPDWQITTGKEKLQPDKEIILLSSEEDKEKGQVLLKLGPTLLTGASFREEGRS